MKYPTSICLQFIAVFCFSQQLAIEYHGARSLGLGQTYTNTTGIEACYNNPAGLQEIHGIEINLGVENSFEIVELMAYQLAVAGPLGNFGSLGLDLVQFGSGPYINQRIGLVYSKRIFEKWAIGAQFDWMHTRIEEYGSANHFTFEFGMISQILENLALGVHLFSPYGLNFSSRQKIPTVMAIGILYQVSPQLDLYAEVEKNTFHPVTYKAALHYRVKETFGVMMGLFTESISANVTGGIEYILIKKYKMNLSVSYNQYLGLSSGLGMNLAF